jgi:hypothetical protein
MSNEPAKELFGEILGNAQSKLNEVNNELADDATGPERTAVLLPIKRNLERVLDVLTGNKEQTDAH